MEKRPIPDCMSCWKQDTCGMAEEGYFCGAWQSREPEERHPTPDELWERGETPCGDI